MTTEYQTCIVIGIIFIIIYLCFEKYKNKTEPYLDIPAVYWPLDYKYGQTNIGSTKDIDNNTNTLFSAHPRKLVHSKNQNEWTKHIRLNDGGGVMYCSNNVPSESNCNSIQCPSLVQDLWTLKNIDHYNPYPLRKDKLQCWQCP